MLTKARMIGQSVCGNEADNLAWFDQMIERTEAFKIHKEVKGYYLQPRPRTEDKEPRIDRLLLPLKKAVTAGWAYGAIGIEGKADATKAGKPISQAIDYARSVFRLDSGNPGLMVVPTWIFLYPFENPHCDLESIMAQNRIGYVSVRKWQPENAYMTFACSGNAILRIEESGKFICQQVNVGNKRGSR